MHADSGARAARFLATTTLDSAKFQECLLQIFVLLNNRNYSAAKLAIKERA